ncbi:hypothetical protein MAP00_004230 [Monascus purpureus]|nr:hypothetical protein MAP00_004230 [Monascus purpureus]
MKQGWRRHIGYRQGVSHNPNSVVAFTWSTGGDITHDRFWAGFRAYMDFFVESVLRAKQDSGGNRDASRAVFQHLRQLAITFTPKTRYVDGFYDAWNASFPLEAVEKTQDQLGGSCAAERDF